MKLFLALFCFIIFSTESYAQVFFPMANWNCSHVENIPKANLIYWIDVDDILTTFSDSTCITPAIVNGANVLCIRDKSANAFGATATGTCTTGPTLATNSQNGKSGIRFTGVSTACLEANNAVFSFPSDEYSYFVVTRPSTAMAGYGSPFNTRGDSNTLGVILYGYNNNFQFWHYSNGIWNASGNFSYIIGTTYILESSHKRSSMRDYYRNGTRTAGTTINTVINSGSVGRIGRSYTSGGGYPYNGYIYEILVYDKQLSQADHWCIRKYLTQKWGVTTL